MTVLVIVSNGSNVGGGASNNNRNNNNTKDTPKKLPSRTSACRPFIRVPAARRSSTPLTGSLIELLRLPLLAPSRAVAIALTLCPCAHCNSQCPLDVGLPA